MSLSLSRFFYFLKRRNILWRIQCLSYSRSLLVIHFKYSSMYTSIPNFQFIRLPSTSLLGNQSLFSKSVSLFCINSIAQLCPTLCNPMNRSTPGLPVHHKLPEFTQAHIHRVSDAIQPSHPLSSLSPPAPIPSQHQSLFQ